MEIGDRPIERKRPAGQRFTDVRDRNAQPLLGLSIAARTAVAKMYSGVARNSSRSSLNPLGVAAGLKAEVVELVVVMMCPG